MVRRTTYIEDYAPTAAAWKWFWWMFYLRIAIFAALLPVLFTFLGEAVRDAKGLDHKYVLLEPAFKAFSVLFFFLPLIRIALNFSAGMIPIVPHLVLAAYEPIVVTLQGFVRDLFVLTPRMWIAHHVERWWLALHSPDFKKPLNALLEFAVLCAIFLVSAYFWKPYYAAWLAQS